MSVPVLYYIKFELKNKKHNKLSLTCLKSKSNALKQSLPNKLKKHSISITKINKFIPPLTKLLKSPIPPKPTHFPQYLPSPTLTPSNSYIIQPGMSLLKYGNPQ